MAKTPKTGSDKIPQIDEAQVKAAQERLKARIEDSQKRDEARKSSEDKPLSQGAKPKKAAKAPPVKKTASSKSGVSLATVAVCSLFAAGIGGAIGWLGPQYMGGSDESATVAQLQSRLSAAEAQIKTQDQTLKSAQSGLSRVSEVDGLQAQIRTISGAVDENAAAIAAAKTERIDMAARMDVTAALIGEEGAAQPSLILERIEAMETKVTEMAARPAPEASARGMVMSEPSVISYETAGSAKAADEADAGEANDAAAETVQALPDPQEEITSQGVEPVSTPAPIAVDYDFIGNFPRAAMLAAVAADAQPVESKNWFKRQLDKHMQSGASAQEKARRDITRAEALTQSGDVAAAANLIKRQSPAVQKAARAWLSAAQTQN